VQIGLVRTSSNLFGPDSEEHVEVSLCRGRHGSGQVSRVVGETAGMVQGTQPHSPPPHSHAMESPTAGLHRVRAFVHACLSHTFTQAHTHIHLYTHTRMHTHTHTHTHTQLQDLVVW